MTWNAHSLRPRKAEFFDFMCRGDIAVSVVLETFLKPNDTIAHPQFHVIRLDRESSSRGVASP